MANRWGYALVLLPAVTEWLDNTSPSTKAWAIGKSTVLGAVIGIGIWRLYRDADKLKKLAETDALTGLCNRRRFNADLEVEAVRARRLKIPLTLLYLDVDHFKSINDTYGHTEGDRILVESARFLRRSVRRHVDRCYRIGGDEFAVLMVGARVQEAVAAIKRRRNALTADALLDQKNITFSVGAVELNGDTPAQLVKKADRYMYAAKKGRNISTGGHAGFATI